MPANYNSHSDDKEFQMFVNREETAEKNKGDLELGGTSAIDEGDQKLVAPDQVDPKLGQWDGDRWISFEQPCDNFDLIACLEKFKKDIGAGSHDIDIYEILKPPDMLTVLKEIAPAVYKDVADMDELHSMHRGNFVIGIDETPVPSRLRAFVENRIDKADEKNTLLVSYLPRNKRDSQSLRKFFEPFGDVTAADVVIDPKTNRAQDYGFVDFLERDQAQLAIEKLNRYGIKGRGLDDLRVEWAAASKLTTC
ncbi:hypothetical protein OROMI_014907 [Orobanche minor]